MSGMGEESGFERRARAVLEESLTRVDARTRSRLNRARQRALEAAAARRRSAWYRSFGALPIAGAVAAGVLAIALALFMDGTFRPAPRVDSAQPSIEVLDMLADEDGISFMENYDHSFYEWAAAQADAGNGDSGAGPNGTPGGDAGGAPGGGTSG